MAIALLVGHPVGGADAGGRPVPATSADAAALGPSVASPLGWLPFSVLGSSVMLSAPAPIVGRAAHRPGGGGAPAAAARIVAPAPPAVGSGSSAVPGLPRGRWPTAGAPFVVREYAPPALRWLAGHRGLDLAAPPGTLVLAAADGVVAFAGAIGGKPVVSVRHGAVRTTYEPVVADVVPGQAVRRGTVIGRVAPSVHCPGRPACLHWGLRMGDAYLDPRLLLGGTVRLFPLSEDLSRGPATSGHVIWLGGR